MSLVLFYDLETTGLPKRGDDPLMQPGIIQIGACMVDTSRWYRDNPVEASIIREFDMKVNPELSPDRWEPGASKINGVYYGDRDSDQSFFTVGAEFGRFATGAEFLSGYNICGFDNKILMWQLRRYGMEMNFPWPVAHVDIMDLAKRSGRYSGKRGTKAPKLVTLYQDISGKPLEGAHDALADVRATVVCARELAGGMFD